jgi:hydroxymethylglutaryl-CoA lyase
MAERVEIFEVGPRDGLQNEARMIPTAEKIALIDCLSGCGIPPHRGGEFRQPKWVPQMADAGRGAGRHRPRARRAYAALTPNLKG